MDAATIIAGWKQRLIALADSPEYVFRDTPQHLIDEDYRRLTAFVGFPEAEVAAAEARLGVLAQIDSEHDAGIMWGDVGCVYLFVSKGSDPQVSLNLQCC